MWNEEFVTAESGYQFVLLQTSAEGGGRGFNISNGVMHSHCQLNTGTLSWKMTPVSICR